jgi:hypothetical protein
MPVAPSALAALIQENVNSDMQAIAGYAPLAQANPSYFIEMCTAIGIGIASGSPLITFTTSDTGSTGAPPIPGVGAGVGITPDPTFFVQDLYTRVRTYVIEDFGSTNHEAWPPSPGNSGEYLKALCQGINDSITTLYPTSWILASVHPLIYIGTGTIENGDFSGLVATEIQSLIISAAPNFIGKFWPRLAQAISESYVALIEQHSTGTVTITGVCVPSVSQICGITPSSGTGTGTAT